MRDKTLENLVSACVETMPEVEFKVYGEDEFICKSNANGIKHILKAYADERLILENYNSRGGTYLGSFYLNPKTTELVVSRTQGYDEGEFINSAFEKFSEKQSDEDDALFEIITDEICAKNPKSVFTLPFTINDHAFTHAHLLSIPSEEELIEAIDEAWEEDVNNAQFDIIFEAINSAFPAESVSWLSISDELQERLLDYVQTAFCIEPPYDQIISTVNTEKRKVSC